MTPLIISCKNGHLEVALHLSRQPNSNLNHTDKDGNSALYVAAKSGFVDVAINLLEQGAYVNTQNKV